MDINKYLEQYNKQPEELSPKKVKEILQKLGNIQNKLKVIHIAGTSGKGSCVNILSHLLENMGYRVGKFLSPHYEKVNERISINGQDILDIDLEFYVNKIEQIAKENNIEKLTFFELITLVSILYFYSNKCDFIVIECGLGGISDATNVFEKPIISILTSIGYDHQKILGDTLEKITLNKCGIIKENSNTITISSNLTQDINKYCNQRKNKLYIVNQDEISKIKSNKNYQQFTYKDIKVITNQLGKYQRENIAICLEAILLLNNLAYINFNKEETLYINILNKGRNEEILKKPKVIFDSCHNLDEVKSFLELIKNSKNNVFIISILKRKDYKQMLEEISKQTNSFFYLTSGNSNKYVRAEELKKYMKYFTNNCKAIDLKDIKDIIKDNNVYYIIGSIYIYKDVKEMFE